MSHPCAHDGGVRTNALAPPQRDATVVHNRTAGYGVGPIPQLVGALVPHSSTRQSRGAVVQAFDDTRPRPLRAAPAPPSGRRVPPHDLEAEESLLGAMLLSNDAASVGIERCSAADFYKPAHGHIFGAIRALMERGEAIDAVTVTDELKRSGVLEAVGDPSIFISLQANTPSIANARHYAEIVEEHALLRKLIGVAGEIADIGYSVPEDVKAAVDEAEQMMFNVAERRTADTMRPLHELLGARARPHRGAGQAGLGHHRRGDRLPRAGQDPARLPALVAEHRGRPPRHGKDELRPRDPGQRRAPGAAARVAVLARDGPPRADPAPAGLRGRGQRAEPADRPDPHPGLEQDRDGRHPAVAARRSSSTTTPT